MCINSNCFYSIRSVCVAVVDVKIVDMAVNKTKWTENSDIKLFQEYLRIRTDHPNVNYGEKLFH